MDVSNTFERQLFDLLLARTQTEHALRQGTDEYNDIPSSMSTIYLLGSSVDQLRAIYDARAASLHSWPASPSPITTNRSRFQHYGDERFQRAYMDFFSLSHTNKGPYPTGSWAASELVHQHRSAEGKILLHGLFSQFGRSLLLLSDGFEIPTAVMVVQALALAAVDWSPEVHRLMDSVSRLAPPSRWKAPRTVLERIGGDGRFTGLSGSGLSNAAIVLNDESKFKAIAEYVRLIDASPSRATLNQLSRLSVSLACATHKPDEPAFDAFLATLPAFVVSLRLMTQTLAVPGRQPSDIHVLLVRGVVMLIVIAYVTQLRPVIDEQVVPKYKEKNAPSWEQIMYGFYGESLQQAGEFFDLRFLRLLRSIRVLAEHDEGESLFYREMAAHLVAEWHEWSGFAQPGEVYLNVRL